MARRTKEQLRAEFERLLEIYQVISEFERSEMYWPEGLEDLRPTPDGLRNAVTSGHWTLSQQIRGIETMIMEFQLGLNDYDPETHHLLSPPERGPETPRFLALYKQRTGRDFHLDVTHPAKTVRAPLKRGRIRNEFEYRVVQEFLNDLSQTDLNEDQTANLETLCAEYLEASSASQSS